MFVFPEENRQRFQKSLTSETASRTDVSRAGHVAVATLLARRLSPYLGSITGGIDQVSVIFPAEGPVQPC